MSLERIEDSYDIPAAKAALEEYATTRMKSKTAYLQLASFCQDFPDMYTVIKPEAEARGSRLGIYADAGETVNEAVVRYQGVLFAHDLPPVTKKPKIDDKGRRFLSQSISVTGFGCNSFQQAHNGGMVAADHLGSYLTDDTLPSWKSKSFHEYDGMQACNRYYSYKKNNNTTPVVPFPRTVDPFHTLSEMAGDDFEHTQDNEVDYLVCLQSEDGKMSYRPKNPATFLAGDIVEVQVSLAVFRTREGKKMLNPVLRGVTLLSDKFSKAARIKQMKAESKKNDVETPALKRKSGYEFDEEDIDYAQKNFKKMCI